MRWLNQILGGAFLLTLSLPGIMALDHGAENAKRAASIVRSRPNPKPAVPATWTDARELPERVDNWFSDAWGGRERALRAGTWLSMRLFGTSPAGHLFFGKDGWVFTRRSKSMESFTGTAPMTEDLLAKWQHALEDRRSWLAERGIDHLVVLVPHKSTIYPEKLPDALQREQGVSRREQFLAWMQEHSEVRVLDIAPALLAAKPKPGTGDTSLRDLYSPLGVHWTVLGGHAAYAQIANDLAERHGTSPPHPLSEFNVEVYPGMGDSWAGRMLLDGVIEMKNLRLDPKRETGITESLAPGGGRKDLQFQNAASQDGEKRLRIVMAHDSFGPEVRGLLARHASLLESRWRGWLEEDVIERVQPDVVIELYSELILETQRPVRRPEFRGPEVAEEFAEAEPLLVLDLSAPLDFGGRTKQSSVTIENGAAVIQLHRGVTRLRIPPPATPPPPGSKLILKLDVQTEKAGNLGLYRAEQLDDTPVAAKLIPLEVGPETPPAYLPLAENSGRESTWLFMPVNLGRVTLRGFELRVR